MSDDLVSRLEGALAKAGREWWYFPLINEAAQALTEARAEIERLTEQVFELEHGVEDQMEEAAYHAKQRAAAESELSTLRARVREVVGPFVATTISQTGDIIGLMREDFRAARQLMEEVK